MGRSGGWKTEREIVAAAERTQRRHWSGEAGERRESVSHERYCKRGGEKRESRERVVVVPFVLVCALSMEASVCTRRFESIQCRPSR